MATGGISVEKAKESRACNGHEALCERRLDRLALVATHNAMSAASEPGWLFANQQRGIADQLEAGVHALLYDTHYGIPAGGGRIFTDLGDIDNVERQAYVEEIGARAVDAALQIRDRIGGTADGERGIYLCHRFCELGATPLEDALRDIREHLVNNPKNVLVVVNEDYVEPAEYVERIRAAGLSDYAYRGSPERFPTLRQMIDSGQRVLFVAEHRGGGAPWYRAGYADGTLQETPYSFKDPGELTAALNLAASCKPNRGGRSGALLLLNHWIDTSPAPRPSNAAKVNARAALLERVRVCRRDRGRTANLIGIDFYETGDAFGVVDTLNGVSGD
jgi:hypothetical protein